MKKLLNAALLSRVNTIVDKRSARAIVARGGNEGEKRKWFNFVAKDDEATLYIYDEISSWWGVGANEFVSALNDVKEKTLNIHINSPGGSVFEGFAIYAAVVAFADKKKATVNVVIDGWAASIASVIAMAGDHIKIGEHAALMIHKPWSYAIGDAEDMREEAEVLDLLEDSIIDIYQSRTNGDRDEIKQWVADETWFRGNEAVDAGFADEVIPLKKKGDSENSKAQPAASHDAEYFAAIFPNMPTDVSEALLNRSGTDQTEKELPKTIREFKNLLREIGFSNKQADAIAGHGFRDKSEVRDEPEVTENPTTTDRRDGAEKRDETLAALRAAVSKTRVINVTHLT